MANQGWSARPGYRQRRWVNAEGKALNNAAVAQNARVRMISGQVVSGVVDSDGNILINL